MSGGQGKEFIPKTGKKKTAHQYIKEVNRNPERFGTSKAHIKKIDDNIKKADRILERDSKGVETREKTRELKVGLIIRANGRLGVITEINELIKVKFPTGSEKEYPTNKITFCRDQKKAKEQHQEQIERRKKQ